MAGLCLTVPNKEGKLPSTQYRAPIRTLPRINISRETKLMGLPNNYSVDLPIRCLDLLDLALPVVQNDETTATSHRGPLTTTLTLALATPMLGIPIEGIQKYLGHEGEGYADDRKLSEHLARRLQQAVNEKRLKDHAEFSAF